MIYTITTNPSLDYYINLEEDIKFNSKNRSSVETYDAGGKGVNVSIFLDELGMSSIALGFLGGFTKDYYLNFINRYKNIQPSFTSINENTRINITNLSDNTSFNAKGPTISDNEFNKLSNKLNNLYKGDFVVLSGNVQEDIKNKVIDNINNLDLNDIKLILDTDKDIIDNIKLDNSLIVKIGDDFNNFDDAKVYINELLNKNVKYVLFESRSNNDVCLFSKENIFKYKEENKPNIHYADSLVAGLIFSFARGASSFEAFCFAIAASHLLDFSGYDNDILSKIDNEYNIIEKNIIND